MTINCKNDRYQITIQRADDGFHKDLFHSLSSLRKWAKITLATQLPAAQMTIRLVSLKEITELNSIYRRKNKPTNVLSFPFELPDKMNMEMPILGDIVICSEVINQEAIEQHKSVEAHFAHMVIHGLFHLLGYNHENDQEAKIMKTLEKQVLKKLGFANPYNERHR